MARFVDAIDAPVCAEEAFDFLADFSNSAEWDPGVESARRLTAGEVGVGTRFVVTVSFLWRSIPLEYEIMEFDRPSRLVLAAANEFVRSVDEITVVPSGEGARVFYEARLEPVGIFQLADPALDLLFQGIGRVASRGLRERLAQGGLVEDLRSQRSVRPGSEVVSCEA